MILYPLTFTIYDTLYVNISDVQDSFCLRAFFLGRPKDEEPHIKRSVKKKKEIIEYIVRVNLKDLGIDETNFDELQELFKMFDNDKDGILSMKEFEKILSVLGRSGKINFFH